VDRIIAALDPAGRWITKERSAKRTPPEPVISTKAWIQKVETLADSLTRVAPVVPDQ